MSRRSRGAPAAPGAGGGRASGARASVWTGPCDRPGPWRLAAAGAGLAAALSFCLSTALAGRAPFGDGSRNVNDLGNQFIAYHAGLWDLLHGSDLVTWSWNWNSGLGVPFWPDYATYLGGPFPLLVALFPREHIETAVFVITALRLAAAAAAMTLYLRRLRPAGAPAWAALLAFGYATCGWALDDGSYVPMWLDGLIALPVLGIVAEWARERRRFALGVALVAGCWWANYYTAYMASLGAAALLLARVAAHDRPREAALAMARFAVRGACGVVGAAVVLAPTIAAVRAAQDTPGVGLPPAHLDLFAARLLPLSEGVGVSPGVAAGSAALLLVAELPWHTGVRPRVRAGYLGGLALLVASMMVPLTQLLWNAGDAPNGSPYRMAFVLAGWLVVTAWVCVADAAPSARAVAGGLALVGGLAAYVALAPPPRVTVAPYAWLSTLVVALATAAVVVLVTRARPGPTSAPDERVEGSVEGSVAGPVEGPGTGGGVRSRSRFAPLTAPLTAPLIVLASVPLVGLVVAENVAAGVVIDAARDRVLPATDRWEPRAAAVEEAVAAQLSGPQGWPGYRMSARTDAVPSANSGLLAGYPGLAAYSSVVPAATSQALTALGVTTSGFGRSIRPAGADGLDPLLAVSGVLRTDGASGVRVEQVAAHPMVTVLPTQAAPAPQTGQTVEPEGPAASGAPTAQADGPFARRNALMLEPAYSTPQLEARTGAGTGPYAPGVVAAGERIVLTGRCAPGRTVQLYAPVFAGRATLAGSSGGTGGSDGTGGSGGSGGSEGSGGTGGSDGTGASGRSDPANQPDRTVTLAPPGGRYVRGTTGVLTLGTVPADGRVEIALTAAAATSLPPAPVGCLDTQAAAADARRAAAQAPAIDIAGPRVSASWNAPRSGVAVVATTATPAWRCEVDGALAQTGEKSGLLAVPLASARSLTCTHTVSLLGAGAAVSAAWAVLLAAGAAVALLRRRRREADAEKGVVE